MGDYVSFDPRMPMGLQLFVYRVARDENYIVRLKAEVAAFLDEVDDIVQRLTNLSRSL
jgi:hypothetical protein